MYSDLYLNNFVPWLPSATAAAADLGVDKPEDVGEDVSDVRKTQQHQRDPEQRVRNADQTAPECLRRDMTVTCP